MQTVIDLNKVADISAAVKGQQDRVDALSDLISRFKKILDTGILVIVLIFAASCSSKYEQHIAEQNVKSYAHTRDEIINKGNIKLFDSDFFPNVL